MFGIDYAWGRPSIASLQAAGVQFACRYLSHDTTGKNLTDAEAQALSLAGIPSVCVWESTSNRALDGHAAGVQDAADGLAQAMACGMPVGRPIYFAVDWDASPYQQSAINAYLDGAATVLGVKATGIYGGYYPVKRALDGGHAQWGWQTYAWSGGQWDPRAQIQQYSNDQIIDGVGLDYDRATATDFGQWATKTGVPTTIHPLLKQGSTGPAVVLLQQDLNNLDKAGLATDGNFGPLTLAAVKVFQAKKNLVVDGIVGPHTWAALG